MSKHPADGNEFLAAYNAGMLRTSTGKVVEFIHLNPPLKLENFVIQQPPRPLTAEEIQKGPVEFWARVGVAQPNHAEQKCTVSHGYESREGIFEEKGFRAVHLREVLPPLQLSVEELEAWSDVFTDIEHRSKAKRHIADFIKFLAGKESARFEKGGV